MRHQPSPIFAPCAVGVGLIMIGLALPESAPMIIICMVIIIALALYWIFAPRGDEIPDRNTQDARAAKNRANREKLINAQNQHFAKPYQVPDLDQIHIIPAEVVKYYERFSRDLQADLDQDRAALYAEFEQAATRGKNRDRRKE